MMRPQQVVDDGVARAKLASSAGCRRGSYDYDLCVAHGRSPWPYDEQACMTALQVLGYPARQWLGDGRARGKPVCPVGP